MSKTTKSPRELLRRAFAVGEQTLPLRWHRFSPKIFTPAQLFSCLILKAYLLLDYRHTEQFLKDCPDLCSVIGLKKVPDYSTLCKAEKRLFSEPKTLELLQETIKQSMTPRRMKNLVELAAIDGSGFESRHISEHYRKRQNMTGKVIPHKKHPKLSIVIDTATHMILAVKTSRGPKPDNKDFEPLLEQAQKKNKIKYVAADAGYDSEHAHEFARKILGIRSIIPPLIGRRTNKLPTGRFRRLMATQFDYGRYGQRWQVETVFSMLKRRLKSSLTARNYYSQCRELRIKAVTLNLMILFFCVN